MSDETKTDTAAADLEALQRAISALTTERDGLRDELRDTRHEARDRRHEAKGLAEQLIAATKERDEFRARAETDPDGLRKALAETQGLVRTLKHAQAFAKVAGSLNVKDGTKQADLFALAKYQPEGDEPDETKIAASFTEALKGRPWLVDTPTTTEKPAAGAATNGAGASGAKEAQSGGKPGPGADRGQSLEGAKPPPANFIAGRI
jgi:hypothetical protein